MVRSQVPDLLNGLDGRFDVVECAQCRFAYTNPRPTAQTFGYFFPDDSGHYSPPVKDDKMQGNSLKRKALRSALTGLGYRFERGTTLPWLINPLVHRFFAWHLKNLHVPRWKPNGTLLDVGCSTGSYLYMVRSLGWNVSGVEFNKTMASLAQHSMPDATIYQEPFETAAIPPASFDVVRMGMVIDHLHDPITALKKVRSLLKPDGVAYFSFVNFGGVESRLFKEHAYPLQLPTHLTHFTEETFSNALRQAGLQRVDASYHAVDRDLIASVRYQGRMRLHRLLSSFWIRNLLVRPAIFTLAKLGATSRLTVVAQNLR